MGHIYNCKPYFSQKPQPRKMKSHLVIIMCACYIFWQLFLLGLILYYYYITTIPSFARETCQFIFHQHYQQIQTYYMFIHLNLFISSKVALFCVMVITADHLLSFCYHVIFQTSQVYIYRYMHIYACIYIQILSHQ